MKLIDYLSTRNGAMLENKYSRIVILGLVGVVCVLSMTLATKSTSVVMVPPLMSEQMEVSANSSSKEAQVAWGMFIANTLGNVTPSSAPKLREIIAPYLAPSIYNEMMEGVETMATEMREEQFSMNYVATKAYYDGKVNAVVISGELIFRGLRGSERRVIRSYEMKFETVNYKVLLASFRPIDGEWRREGSK